MKYNSFLDFLRSHNDNSPGIIPWVSRYFLKGKRGKGLRDDIDIDWIGMALSAPAAYRDALVAGIKQAYSEYLLSNGAMDSDDCDSIRMQTHIEVESTIGKFEKVIKRNVESGKVSSEERVMVGRFVGPVARVDTGAKFTVSLGDFESVSVRKEVSVPCYVEEILGISDLSDRWIEERLGEELSRLISLRTGSVSFDFSGNSSSESGEGETILLKSPSLDTLSSGDTEVGIDGDDEDDCEIDEDVVYEESDRSSDDAIF